MNKLSLRIKDLVPTQPISYTKRNDINELAKSIKKGFTEDKKILVYYYKNRYWIHDGHHRVMACILLGKTEIPYEIIDYTPCDFIGYASCNNQETNDWIKFESSCFDILKYIA